MRKSLLIALAMVAALTLLAGAGCSKKRSGSMPPGASGADGAVVKDHDWRAGGAGGLDESGLTDEQRRARQREQFTADLSQRINFDFNSNDLNQEAKGILQKKAEILKSQTNITVVIEGHCDDRGTEEYNLALGERRARAAYEFLVLLGVAPERLSIVSFGEEKPLDPGQNEAAWAANRRDEFRPSF